MTRGITARWLHVIEIAYAVATLFVLTQGPVLRLWRPSEKLLESLPNPSVAHAHFATFVAVQLPAVALLARRIDIGWWRDRGNQALFALLCWLGLSVTWSTFARQSAPEFVALVLTTLFGLYLATSFDRHEFWLVVASAMSLGVGLSWFAVMRLWDAAVNFQEDYWVGIYYNRNSFAPVTAMALIGALGVVSASWSRSVNVKILARAAIVSVAVALAATSGIEMLKSGSQTSPLALGIALAACAAWIAVRELTRRIKSLSVFETMSVPLVLFVVALMVFVAVRREIGVAGLEGQTTAFNQRSGIWQLSWAGILEKPWHGWGWMSAWHTPLFFLSSKEPTWMSWGLEWSHNGYHDLLLGGGVPAGLLFAMYIVFSSRPLSTQPTSRVAPRLLVIVFVMAAATQESFFIGSHFLWALLVAALAIEPLSNSSIKQQDSGERSA